MEPTLFPSNGPQRKVKSPGGKAVQTGPSSLTVAGFVDHSSKCLSNKESPCNPCVSAGRRCVTSFRVYASVLTDLFFMYCGDVCLKETRKSTGPLCMKVAIHMGNK